jgi:quercetin dioxygenase-like cupin family protein
MTFVRDGSTGLLHVPAGDGPAHWMVGDTYTLKASGLSTGGALGLVEASIPPGSGPPPHRHRFEDEAIYLLAGSLEIRGDENDVVDAAAGDFVFMPRGALHSFRNTGVAAARALIIITPAGFETFFGEAGAPARPGVPAPPHDAAELARILDAAPQYGFELGPPPAGPAEGTPDR